MNESISKLWWDNVTGPTNMVKTVVASLRNRKSVLLSVPEDLPWRKQMRSSIEYTLREKESDLLITYIDCQEECSDVTDVSDFLMQRFAYSDVRDGYRASSGVTIQKYMQNSRVLKNLVLWIKGMNAKQTEAWYTFCKKYQSASLYDGLFVIELYDNAPIKGVPSHIEQIEYSEFVSYYDALLFDSMVVSASTLSTEWKQYIATLTSLLCERDVELSERFINETDFTSMEPVTSLISISANEYFEKRRQAENIGASHPFYLIRQNNFDELQHRVWKAQLQIVFALIEIERIAFITKWKQAIEEALNTPYWDYQSGKSCYIKQYGERLTNPFDAEIGTLDYMLHLRKNNNTTEYLLYIPYDVDRQRLELLHSIRNSLAHMKACTVQEMNELFSAFPCFSETICDWLSVYNAPKTTQHTARSHTIIAKKALRNLNIKNSASEGINKIF